MTARTRYCAGGGEVLEGDEVLATVVFEPDDQDHDQYAADHEWRPAYICQRRLVARLSAANTGPKPQRSGMMKSSCADRGIKIGLLCLSRLS